MLSVNIPTTFDDPISAMKKFTFALLFGVLCLSAQYASASLIVTYTASADPNLDPDANANTVNIWNTVFSNPGNSSQNGSFLGDSATNGGGSSAGAGNPAWAIYANSGQTSTATSVAFSGLVGRSLNSVGDNVSIDFDNGFIDTGNTVGVRFLNGSTAVSTFRFSGGDTNYRIDDSSTGFDTSIGFTANGFNVRLTLDNTSGAYTLVANGNTFTSRTLDSGAVSITGIEVFNDSAGGGNERNVFFNNLRLEAVPEPTTILTFGLCLTGMGIRRRRK